MEKLIFKNTKIRLNSNSDLLDELENICIELTPGEFNGEKGGSYRITDNKGNLVTRLDYWLSIYKANDLIKHKLSIYTVARLKSLISAILEEAYKDYEEHISHIEDIEISNTDIIILASVAAIRR